MIKCVGEIKSLEGTAYARNNQKLLQFQSIYFSSASQIQNPPSRDTAFMVSYGPNSCDRLCTYTEPILCHCAICPSPLFLFDRRAVSFHSKLLYLILDFEWRMIRNWHICEAHTYNRIGCFNAAPVERSVPSQCSRVNFTGESVIQL